MGAQTRHGQGKEKVLFISAFYHYYLHYYSNKMNRPKISSNNTLKCRQVPRICELNLLCFFTHLLYTYKSFAGDFQ